MRTSEEVARDIQNYALSMLPEDEDGAPRYVLPVLGFASFLHSWEREVREDERNQIRDFAGKKGYCVLATQIHGREYRGCPKPTHYVDIGGDRHDVYPKEGDC